MACCDRTGGGPGTPTLSSGHTEQLARNAVRCDQARVLARLQGYNVCCSTPPRTNKAALYASVLEQDAATSCQPSPDFQAKFFPKVGVPESIRIQRVQTATIECAYNPYNPETRFAQYQNLRVGAPCAPSPSELINSTNPKPTFLPGCTPSRFF